MNNKTEMMMDPKAVVFNAIGWIFGVIVFAIGTVNVFWGNDPGFGIFLILLSAVYFPPVSALIGKIIARPIPALVKTLLGIFILWAALGVGELFDKIDLMMKDLG